MDLSNSCTYYRNASEKEIAEIDNKVRVFLCSSVQEGFGLPGLEAMACGAVLVTSKFQGVLEYAVDGENALMAPVKNEQALADCIERVFEDEELAQRLSEAGVETGRGRSLEKMVGEFMNEIMKCGDE